MKSKILILGFLFLIFGCQKENKTASSFLELVPVNPSLLIKINSFDSFKESLKNNDFLKRFESSKTYKGIAEIVDNLNYVQPQTSGLLAFSESIDKEWGYTFITDFSPNVIHLDSIKNKTVESFAQGREEIDRYTIDGTVFFASRLDDKIAISSSQAVLEDLLENFGKVEIPKELQRLYRASGVTKPASLFMDMDENAELLESILKDNPGIDITNFSDWLALDIDLQLDQINLRGMSMVRDSTQNYLDLFRNTTPLVNTIQNFAPKNSEAILSYTFNDYRTFAKNKQGYLGYSIPEDSLFTTVEEIGLIYLNSKKAVLLNTFGSETIAEFLGEMQVGSLDFQGNEILELGQSDFLEKLLSPLVKDFDAHYVTVLDNAFIFAGEKEILQTVIRSYKNNNTFRDTPVYETAVENIASESTVLYISDSKGIKNLLDTHFSKTFVQDFAKSKLQSTVYAAQVVADKDIFHTNAVVRNITPKRSNRRISKSFSKNLESEIATNPQFVVNHNTKTKEIVVQDEDNTLHLISRNGQTLWSKKLDGRIQGQVHQVDIYKNGRLQLAFTTNNQFLILDRNGKEVRPFVKSFEGGNLRPLAVFDYDGNKDYRFVVVQNEKIFMYNNKGDIVTGFTYTRAEHSVLNAPKHFRIGKKDYLTFKLSDGSLKILSRVGKVRVKVDKKIDFSENEIYVYKNKFIATDKKGILYQIDERGKTTEANLNLNEDHGLDATNKTLALINNNELSIKGNKVELDLGVYLPPKIFYIYDKIYVTLTDIQNQRVYLFDSNAKPIPNFPIIGTSPIDLGDVDNNRRLEVVVKDQDNSFIMYSMN
ncbi:ribonuclease HII [Ulvibacterium sp.]|uniref:ribonuclease HII n=1 Tax=Ulvibacterium sp. TaxID=2665914 RepID=UPI00260EB8F4|nr:ribonuclease HII [Ulvibacterium sp.]